MKLVRGAGFGRFLDALKALTWDRAPHPFVLALLEWFWDTTNTFHFPWGEMTITPFDFQMLTGLVFTDKPVVIDESLVTGSEELIALRGPIATISKGLKTIRPSTLLEGFSIPETTDEQRARIICLLMVNSFLVPDAGVDTSCHLRYLASLTDLGMAAQYNWAGLSYAQLLLSMRKTCRQLDNSVNVSISGPWRVIELWAYSYLRPLAPSPPKALQYPAAKLWDVRAHLRPQDALAKTRRKIREMTEAEVHFRPFAGIKAPRSIARARELTATRRVFETPAASVLYLGERVVRQYARDYFVVPMDPPALMMSSDLESALGEDSYEVVSYAILLLEDPSYAEELLPRLVPPVRLVDRPRSNFADGEVPFADLTISYEGPSGRVRELLDEAPESEWHATRSLPPDFSGFNRAGSERILRLVDSLKWNLRTQRARSFTPAPQFMPQPVPQSRPQTQFMPSFQSPPAPYPGFQPFVPGFPMMPTSSGASTSQMPHVPMYYLWMPMFPTPDGYGGGTHGGVGGDQGTENSLDIFQPCTYKVLWVVCDVYANFM
ncbi:protein MAINTENANCE OF MERISTEMS [Beta vulgaris subsp. vulgaris]|uniref:protein MAINTENANCE OF MERISTEMS n=1 Tax=Beta vulgaris subsp. vulgaris TaxID=3555 RepID=UPI00203672AD|nr:protein MAINTENANCE OF MERISTEMS [Beta vulgaris subsp. vulgaris]